MSKFKSLQDAYQYFEENKGSGGGTAGFFSLKNDRETAVVRFLHEGEDDLDWYIVHEAEIQGKRRKVKCTEQADCPLCQAGMKPQLKIFLQLIDKRQPDKILIWERGQTFIPIVMSFIQRYGSLCSQPVEVERLGKPRDTSTTYQLYPLEKDNKTLSELPQRETLAGENGFVLVKNQMDLVAIANGSYIPPQTGNNNGNNFNQGGFNQQQPPQQFNQNQQFNQQPQQNTGQYFNQNQMDNNQQMNQQQNQGVQPRQNPQPGTDIF